LAERSWQGLARNTFRTIANFYEKYTLGPDGKRVYTLKKVVDGKVSKSAYVHHSPIWPCLEYSS
jgi:hypothetical protein